MYEFGFVGVLNFGKKIYKKTIGCTREMRVGKQWVVASVNGDDDKCGSVVVGFVEVYKAVMMLVVVVSNLGV